MMRRFKELPDLKAHLRAFPMRKQAGYFKKLQDFRARLENEKQILDHREKRIAEAEAEREAEYANERKKLDEELQARRTEWENEKKQKNAELAQWLTKQMSALESQIAETRAKNLGDIVSATNTERDRLLREANAERGRLLNEANAERDRLLREANAERGRLLNEANAERDRIVREAKQAAEHIRQEIAAERTAWEADFSRQKEMLKTQSAANEKKAGELSSKEDYLQGREEEQGNRENYLEKRNSELDDLVEERVEARKASFEAKEKEYQDEIQRLRDSLDIQSRLVGAFEQLKRQLGDKNPAEVLRDLNFANRELARLQDELVNRPSAEMRVLYENLEKQAKEQKERADQMELELQRNESAMAEAGELRRKNNELDLENRSLSQRLELAETDARAANDELKRLRSAFERPDEVVARYNEIEMPFFSAGEFSSPDNHKTETETSTMQRKGADRIDEIKWLDEIYDKCNDYGIHFSKRILKAFHTAIKTAEWSPITILAGVSGTGKSLLPWLYSRFGGLLYMPLSVQPNWDSQESMLGFFNLIDNKFDAQPVLRFLAQSQQPFNRSYEERLTSWKKMADSQFVLDPEKHKELLEQLQRDKYPGTGDCMGMVLLDEMNLAHPELYFAEFLSKLELRRGKENGSKDFPYLDVKIGAGLPSYKLPLGRNILWVGTMNQDETTKSLSDKVLDRSIIIYFPRPMQLARREKLRTLKGARELIYKGDFQQWWVTESKFPEELINPYKQFLEKMNDSLGNVGRAIGHRVWQSVEYYMANYPDVRAAMRNGGDSPEVKKAMRIAFEDQLVQKVMPKLRGIDTRGKSKSDCLDKIQEQLNVGIDEQPFNLNEDFELACELGHGQFMWQSANYLNEDEELNAPTEAESASGESDDDSENMNASDESVLQKKNEGEIPPDWFQPNNEKRNFIWNNLSPERRRELIENYGRRLQQ